MIGKKDNTMTPPKILIIDDDVVLCNEVEETLVDMGYAVDKVFDGFHGLEQARTKRYDCILLDIRLPEINGISLLQTIKREKIKSKIIIISGHLAASEKETADFLKPADGILQKPFTFKMLEEKLNACRITPQTTFPSNLS